MTSSLKTGPNVVLGFAIGETANIKAGGAVGGLTAAVGYKAAGYDVNIGKAVGLGALSGGLTGGIGYQNFPWAGDIVASGLVGGGIVELRGGNFAT